ncbi:DUF3000 domain-containing protein [Haloechinothrix sp. LS1_15]|uniref:DUF3000 domain-containing protein n=1 Tax=Haloechinothrix sp. LS1_15 TaxID=2652248 RepID=UPI002947B083|nr:DUF3000 domain-containing protein [Haloechinothrix sp. LS1_15]
MSDAPQAFQDAVTALQSVRPRPELTLEPMRPPQRLAPWSYALSSEVSGPADVLASGRLILLHDPDGHESWQGTLRLVTYVRAELDADLAGDPALASVGWSWLTDALALSGAEHIALGGTITKTSSTRFGEIGGPAQADDLEVRASWTPTSTDLRPHGEAFCRLLASVVGLPPVGVAVFGQRQGS